MSVFNLFRAKSEETLETSSKSTQRSIQFRLPKLTSKSQEQKSKQLQHSITSSQQVLRFPLHDRQQQQFFEYPQQHALKQKTQSRQKFLQLDLQRHSDQLNHIADDNLSFPTEDIPQKKKKKNFISRIFMKVSRNATEQPRILPVRTTPQASCSFTKNAQTAITTVASAAKITTTSACTAIISSEIECGSETPSVCSELNNVSLSITGGADGASECEEAEQNSTEENLVECLVQKSDVESDVKSVDEEVDKIDCVTTRCDDDVSLIANTTLEFNSSDGNASKDKDCCEFISSNSAKDVSPGKTFVDELQFNSEKCVQNPEENSNFLSNTKICSLPDKHKISGNSQSFYIPLQSNDSGQWTGVISSDAEQWQLQKLPRLHKLPRLPKLPRLQKLPRQQELPLPEEKPKSQVRHISGKEVDDWSTPDAIQSMPELNHILTAPTSGNDEHQFAPCSTKTRQNAFSPELGLLPDVRTQKMCKNDTVDDDDDDDASGISSYYPNRTRVKKLIEAKVALRQKQTSRLSSSRNIQADQNQTSPPTVKPISNDCEALDEFISPKAGIEYNVTNLFNEYTINKCAKTSKVFEKAACANLPIHNDAIVSQDNAMNTGRNLQINAFIEPRACAIRTNSNDSYGSSCSSASSKGISNSCQTDDGKSLCSSDSGYISHGSSRADIRFAADNLTNLKTIIQKKIFDSATRPSQGRKLPDILENTAESSYNFSTLVTKTDLFSFENNKKVTTEEVVDESSPGKAQFYQSEIVAIAFDKNEKQSNETGNEKNDSLKDGNENLIAGVIKTPLNRGPKLKTTLLETTEKGGATEEFESSEMLFETPSEKRKNCKNQFLREEADAGYSGNDNQLNGKDFSCSFDEDLYLMSYSSNLERPTTNYRSSRNETNRFQSTIFPASNITDVRKKLFGSSEISSGGEQLEPDQSSSKQPSFGSHQILSRSLSDCPSNKQTRSTAKPYSCFMRRSISHNNQLFSNSLDASDDVFRSTNTFRTNSLDRLNSSDRLLSAGFLAHTGVWRRPKLLTYTALNLNGPSETSTHSPSHSVTWTPMQSSATADFFRRFLLEPIADGDPDTWSTLAQAMPIPRTAMAKFNDDGTPKSILKKALLTKT